MDQNAEAMAAAALIAAAECKKANSDLAAQVAALGGGPIATYIHTSNTEIVLSAVDTTANTFTSVLTA
jgi:hypothetical protein